jgi:hypothetical protein
VEKQPVFSDPSLQMTFGLVGVVAAYILLALLLLSINVASRWLWWVKGAAIVVTTAYFVHSYTSVAGIIGWPTKDIPPEKFEFLWATVVEPNLFYDQAGAIFIWAEPLGGADGAPIGMPRAYRLPFSRELSDQVVAAQALVREGKIVAGAARAIARLAPTDAIAADPQAAAGQRVAGLSPEHFTETKVEIQLEEKQPPPAAVRGAPPPAR